MARKEEKGRKLGSSVHRSVCALSPTSRPPEQPIYDIFGHGEVKVGGEGEGEGIPITQPAPQAKRAKTEGDWAQGANKGKMTLNLVSESDRLMR